MYRPSCARTLKFTFICQRSLKFDIHLEHERTSIRARAHTNIAEDWTVRSRGHFDTKISPTRVLRGTGLQTDRLQKVTVACAYRRSRAVTS